MTISVEINGWVELLGRLRRWLQDRSDPACAQARRLIETFEAYGIARQQIPRVLPPEHKLPNSAFSTADKLKDHMTPELLDWAAEYLAINRSWLDMVADKPHTPINHYKAPARYRDWLVQRKEAAPNGHRWVSVWRPEGEEIPTGAGPLCLIYEECSEGLDDSEFSRYWLLSDGWIIEHGACVENLLAFVAVVRSLDIQIVGAGLPLAQLERLEAGKSLIPEVYRHRRGKWYPEDLVEPLPNQDTEWRQALWGGAQEYLAEGGLQTAGNKLRPPVNTLADPAQ